jgi:excisionase family DNA binding protein
MAPMRGGTSMDAIDDRNVVLLHKIPQVERALNCSRATVYGLIRDGKLEAVKLRRSVRITDRSLRRLIDQEAKS